MNAMDRFRCPAAPLLAMLAALLCGTPGRAQTTTPGKAAVADVIVVGNSQMPAERITSLLKTRAGADYNQALVDEDVRELYKLRAFQNVEVRLKETEPGRVVVYFVLTEHPHRIQEVVYLGPRHIKLDELEEITGLRKGQPLNPITNQVARQAILRKYIQEKGRLFASVELLEGDKPTDTRVVFRITEGPPVKISSISFTGVDFVNAARIRTQIQSSSALLNLIGGEYNPVMVEADVAKLVEYYKTFGFHDVRVTRELVWESDMSRVKLIFHVDEGKRYRLGNIDLEGPKEMPRDHMLTLVRGTPGDFYDENLVKANLFVLKDFQGYRGIDATVKRDLVYKPNGEVDVMYQVQQRPPAVVGEIVVTGNKVTKQNVILRQIPLYPGQVLEFPQLRLAERNLLRLNIFENDPERGIRPTVEVLDPNGPNPVKNIWVNVEETRTGSLLFGLGVNSDAGLSGSIVLNERNFDIFRIPTSWSDFAEGRAFRGAGQEFRVEAVPGTRFHRYTVSFREPFLFDSPYSLGLSGYVYTRRFNEYDEGRVGFRTTLGRRISDHWSVSGTLRVEEVDVDNVFFFAPASIKDDEGSNFLVGLRGAVAFDSRDSFLRPTEGMLVEASAEQVLGDFSFPVLSIEGNKYFTVYQRPDRSGRWVLAVRSEMAWAGDDAPVFERFFAGGFRSIRGFEFRGVGPDEFGFKVGGQFLWLNSIELQVPVLANDQLYLVGFVDSGTVERDFRLDSYRVTAGAGLRIVVPMLGPVPIALDFGFPIVKEPFDVTQVFSFWVGFFN